MHTQRENTLNYKLQAGKYLIADGCQATDEYYDNVILETFISWPGGEHGMANDTFVYCTGGDGAADVTNLKGDVIDTFGIDAANISIIPQEHVGDDMSSGMWVEFDNDFTVTVHDDRLIIGNRYQIEL